MMTTNLKDFSFQGTSSFLALQPYESLRLPYGSLPAVSAVRPILPIKSFTFLQISLHTIPPKISGTTSKSVSLWLKILFGILSVFILFTWSVHFCLFIL